MTKRKAIKCSKVTDGNVSPHFCEKPLYRYMSLYMITSRAPRRAPTSLTVQLHVLGALMLRDMRTRFGGSHWGYVVAVGWPCAHIFVLVAILTLRGLQAPLGDNVILFVATGTTPYITFMYMSRKIMEGIGLNKPLTYFPTVTLFDVIVSRVIVEVVTSFATTACAFIILMCIGVDAIPQYPSQAVTAFLSTIIFSIGMGMINANIFIIFPGWAMGYVLVIVGGYSLSGVFFLPDLLPERVFSYMSWNPMLQNIAWFRSAFYPDYGESVARLYAIMSALVLVVAGLALERLVMRKKMTTI